MLFYRLLNLAVTSLEIYCFYTLSKENNVSGTTVDLFGEIMLIANVVFATIFFLGELIFERESITNKRLKGAYPYTETPVKIALMTTVAIVPMCDSYANIDANIFWLQWLIRIDLILSYLSYAWKTFWPIIIVPVNKALMWINQVVLSILRMIRDIIYSILIWIYDQLFWLKFECELKCCAVKEGQPIPFGRKVAMGVCKACSLTWDLGEWTLSLCGVPVERDEDIVCPSIECWPQCRLRLPAAPRGVYVEIKEDENIMDLPIVKDENHEYLLGFLQHIKSGRFVYPEGAIGVHESRMILGPPVHDPAFVFRFHKDGSFEHDQSELFVHPEDGGAEPGKHLILHEGGHVRKLAYKLHPDGALEHLQSHLFVHVELESKQKPYLFLSTIGHQDYLSFRMMPFKPGTERRCLNSHILRVQLEIPEIYANVTAVECDKCRRSGLGVPSGTPFYHCALCKYDTCVECPLSLGLKGKVSAGINISAKANGMSVNMSLNV